MSPALCLLLSNLIGGASYAATELALRGFTPESIVFWRLFVGCAIFAPLAWRIGGLARLDGRDWAKIVSVGVLGLALPTLLQTWGQELSSATNAALMIGVEPVSIVLLSAAFLGERMSRAQGLAALAALAGASLIVWPAGARLEPLRLRGDVILFFHGFCWALYSVIGKSVLKKLDPFVFTALVSGVALPLVALAAWPKLAAKPAAPPESYWGLGFLVVAVTVLATWLWNKGLEKMPASRLAVFIFIQPLVGAALGVLVDREPLGWHKGLGGALILAGVWGSMRGHIQEAS